MNHELHEQAGLTYQGKNDEGEEIWMGTDRQWSEYMELADEAEAKYEEMEENRIMEEEESYN